MPSSKGKPTDPKLREEAKKEVKNMEKGGGKGSWSAWKASEMAKVYEAKGGGYEETGENPNEAKKGDPKPKSEAVSKGERKPKDAPVGETKAAATASASGSSEKKKTQSSTQKQSKAKGASKAAKPRAQGSRQQPKRSASSKVSAAA